MKKFFSLIFVFCYLFIDTASAQWWVRGGNLLWPHGNVDIQKDLNVGGEATFDSTVTFGDSVNFSGNVNVDGFLMQSGVKELVAYVIWNSTVDPEVTILKNTTGLTFTWIAANAYQMVSITASDTLFYAGRTFLNAIVLVDHGDDFYIEIDYQSVTRIDLLAYDNTQTQTALAELGFYIKIECYPAEE